MTTANAAQALALGDRIGRIEKGFLADLFVVFVRDISDNFLEQVFQRDDSFQTSVFVNHKAEVHLRALHLPQHVFQPRSINDVKRRLQHIRQAEVVGVQQVRHYVLAMNESDHIID